MGKGKRDKKTIDRHMFAGAVKRSRRRIHRQNRKMGGEVKAGGGIRGVSISLMLNY